MVTYYIICPIQTADATQLSSLVASAVWTHPSALVTQFTISCAVELLKLGTGDDIMTSLLKKLSISIKIHVVKPLYSVSKIVDRIRRQSSWATCELCSHRLHRRDATRQLRRVGGMYASYWVLLAIERRYRSDSQQRMNKSTPNVEQLCFRLSYRPIANFFSLHFNTKLNFQRWTIRRTIQDFCSPCSV